MSQNSDRLSINEYEQINAGRWYCDPIEPHRAKPEDAIDDSGTSPVQKTTNDVY
ncbi:hypothetical protein [Thalassoporum mexicanum]|uniref:hypothetical protein n=1 Tax=Thalassoporum mexicanum TaxID=3457544 RepID=UPI0002E2169B